jgi:class 3 adenylate cyclase
MPLDQPLTDMPIVVVREPGRTPLVLVLHQALEVGRDSPGLLIDDPQASRSHLRLSPAPDGVVVTDLGSTNGTLLDGKPIEEPTKLVAGSRVLIGATAIEVLPASLGTVEVVEPSPKTSISRIADEVGIETLPRPPALGVDKTLTIVFTDIENSTEISTSLGDRTWFELLSRHNTLVREQVRANHGVEVKARGDGFMLVFDSTKRALQAMIAAQREVDRAFAGSDPELRIRIGAHTGEAISDESGDMFGYHVNLAARIADQASGGEILVSELLKQIGDARGEFHFGDPRQVQLKGLGGVFNVYPVDWAG